ncbi:6400_t:CDS:2, partial [Racocetra persica]
HYHEMEKCALQESFFKCPSVAQAPSGLQSQLSPAFEDCLKRIEKYFLNQVLSTTVDCIKCGVVINSERDQLFIIYWCDWILSYFNDDDELLKLAKFLYEYLSTLKEKVEIFDNLETEKVWISQLLSSKKNKTKQTPTRASCPACPTGRCTKGHVWDLCSITLSVVADKHARSCSNCNRKILAASDPYRQVDEQSIASSVIVKAIIETCEKCFYCG